MSCLRAVRACPLVVSLALGMGLPAAFAGPASLTGVEVALVEAADVSSEFAPVVLEAWRPDRARLVLYALAGHASSTTEIEAVASLAERFPAELAVAVAFLPRSDLRTPADYRAAVGDAAGQVALIRDDGFAMGRALSIASAPSLVLVDAEGRVHLAGARSLAHPLEAGGTVADYLDRGLKGGGFAQEAALGTYRPPHPLVGRAHPPLALGTLAGPVLDVATPLREGRAVLLVFW